MTHTRRVALAVALLVVAAVTLCAQHAPPRWGGGGVGASSAGIREAHPRVTAVGPFVIVPGTPMMARATVPSHSGGGSWNGSRPTSGGPPPPRPRPPGAAPRPVFGFVPPRRAMIRYGSVRAAAAGQGVRRAARGDPPPGHGAERGDPRPQLRASRDPGRRRLRRGLPRPVARGRPDRGRRDRLLRRALHGRDRRDAVAREDRPPPRPRRRLLARR